MAPDSSFPVRFPRANSASRIRLPAVSTSRRSLADVLRSHARARPDSLAFADADVALTWAEAAARVHRCARAMQDAGVGPGDRVLWLGQNSFRIEELLLACCEIGAMFCPANWRQQPDELAFVIDDLAPALVVWQEQEVGGSVRGRSGRGAPRGAVDPPRHRLAGPAATERERASTRRSSRPGRPTIPTPTRPRTRRCSSSTPRRSTAGRTPRCCPSRALIAQGLLMAPWSGIDDGPRVPQLRAALPHRHVHAQPLDVRDGRHQRLRPAVRRRGAVRRDRTLRRARADSSSDRWSTRSSRRTRTAATTSRRSGAGAATRRSTRGCSPTPRRGDSAPVATGSPRSWAWRRSICSRPDGIGSHGRPSPLVDLRVVDPDGDDVASGRDRRDRRPRCDRDVRVLEPARAQRPSVARRLAPHQRPRPLRSRRFVHVRRAEVAHAEVRGREHLPGRGRELPEDPSGRRPTARSSAFPIRSGSSRSRRSSCGSTAAR